MPGLRLTTTQVERLCSADPSTSASALHALVSAGFLVPMPGGGFGRTDNAAGPPMDSAGRARHVRSPWQRILCLVDLEHDGGDGLTGAAHSALRYAATLAVTHRARVTALQVVPTPSEPALTSVAEELTKQVAGEPFHQLIDVHVTTGSPDEGVARVAREVDADLIVIGRGGRPAGSACPPLPGILRQARCPVLIVHPSGQAAVA